MKRHELTDEQWAFVEPLVPLSTARTGRPPKDRRTQLNGILSRGAPKPASAGRFKTGQCANASYTSSVPFDATLS